MKQTEIKNLVKDGKAIDITTASEKELANLGRMVEIAITFGTYGMNGGLFQSKETGKLYAITSRSSNLFRLA